MTANPTRVHIIVVLVEKLFCYTASMAMYPCNILTKTGIIGETHFSGFEIRSTYFIMIGLAS